MDIEKRDLISQIRTAKARAADLEALLTNGCNKPTFLAAITDAEDELKKLRALLVHHSRVHKKGVRSDGKPDLRFTRNRLPDDDRTDLRKPLRIAGGT